jgi:hypothetical protein
MAALQRFLNCYSHFINVTGALKVCWQTGSSRRPRRRSASKSFAEDGEGSKLIYKLLAHPNVTIPEKYLSFMIQP